MTRTWFNRRDVIASAMASVVACPVAAATVHDVRIEGFEFRPNIIRVRPGDRIRWTNADLAPHTATAVNAEWDTGELARGESIETHVTADMETEFYCVFHPHMKGQIKIV